MNQKNTNLRAEASRKSPESTALEEHLPILDLILERKRDLEAVSAEPLPRQQSACVHSPLN